MQPLIETIDLKKYFKAGKSMLHAVDGVNLAIPKSASPAAVRAPWAAPYSASSRPPADRYSIRART